MASIDGTLSFNDYSTDQNESQMIVDLLLQPHLCQEPEYASLLNIIKERTEGLRVFAVTIHIKADLAKKTPEEDV